MGGGETWLMSVIAQRPVAAAGTLAFPLRTLCWIYCKNCCWPLPWRLCESLSDARGGLSQQPLMSHFIFSCSNFLVHLWIQQLANWGCNQLAPSPNFCPRAIFCGTPMGLINCTPIRAYVWFKEKVLNCFIQDSPEDP